MDMSFAGTRDFSVMVYESTLTTRGNLLSQTDYASLTDDGSDFFTLDHLHSFTSDNIYEVLFAHTNGVSISHYDFHQGSADVGSQLTLLDGTVEVYGWTNEWLANFEMTTSRGAPAEPAP